MERLPPQIASLFERHATLCGFSVRGPDQIPDSCPREEDDEPLFVGDLSVSLEMNAEQYEKIFQEVLAALSQLISEEPEAADTLRGRTFARVVH
jgi:hypothetical protein